MAVVRISDKLKDDIIRNAKASFQPQVDAVTHFSCAPDIMSGDRILDAFIGPENLERMNLLPVGYFMEAESIKITRIAIAEGSTILINKEFPFSGKRRIPYAAPTNKILFITRSYNTDYSATLDPFWDDVRAMVVEWDAKKRAALERQKVFADTTKVLLQQFTTLAPALKAWPALWDLVPEEAKDRHRSVVEREKSTVDLSGVDLSKMTAMATQAKMVR